jgi:hypothetical protein
VFKDHKDQTVQPEQQDDRAFRVLKDHKVFVVDKDFKEDRGSLD